MNYYETNWVCLFGIRPTGNGLVISSDRLIPCRSLSEAFTDLAPPLYRPLRAYFSMRTLHNFKFIAIIFKAFVAVGYERPPMVIVPFAQLSLKLLRLYFNALSSLFAVTSHWESWSVQREPRRICVTGLKDISAWIMDEKVSFGFEIIPRCKM